MVSAGSSPLTRGKREREQPLARHIRLIPAHAGKTETRVSNRRGCAAHPRSRGENLAPVGEAISYTGSSPLTRGKQTGVESKPRDLRLIPAHAGKTLIGETAAVIATAHPRSRGENAHLLLLLRFRLGSSPLTRGKLADRPDHACDAGLIPAHAGKTRPIWWNHGRRRAHPRSRGENNRNAIPVKELEGSSPLTRGKRLTDQDAELAHGLIPAHAGKTVRRSRARRPCWAHPRSRGENPPTVARPIYFDGSSPLTRGKHRLGQGVD